MSQLFEHEINENAQGKLIDEKRQNVTYGVMLRTKLIVCFAASNGMLRTMFAR